MCARTHACSTGAVCKQLKRIVIFHYTNVRLSVSAGIFSYSETLVCSQGKVYSECGPVCPPTCTNPTPPSDCPTDCVPGCFCASNMVDYNGQCVLPSDCTSFTPPPPRPPTIIDTDITSGGTGKEGRETGRVGKRGENTWREVREGRREEG